MGADIVKSNLNILNSDDQMCNRSALLCFEKETGKTVEGGSGHLATCPGASGATGAAHSLAFIPTERAASLLSLHRSLVATSDFMLFHRQQC